MSDPSPRGPANLIPVLANRLFDPQFPRGARASLKRMSIHGSIPTAFYRLMLSYIRDDLESEKVSKNWKTILCLLSMPPNCGFDPNCALGKALALAHFREQRLECLLAASDDTLRTLILRAARQLTAKGIAYDARQFADLLFATEGRERDSVNRRISRDYFSETDRIERELD